MTYLEAMRPEDLLVPTPAGVCCKTGGFHIDPTRPVERALITHGHSDHARAGPWRGAGHAGNARHHAAALWRRLRRLHAGDRLRRERGIQRGDGDVPSRRPCARLGPDRGRARWACGSSRPATTRMSPIRPARRSSWCRATSSSPRRPSGCRYSGTAIPTARSANCCIR